MGKPTLRLPGTQVSVSEHDVVVIGGSAGGIEALRSLVAGLPRDFPAAVFVVIHIGSERVSTLPEILERSGGLPAFSAEDGQKIRPGRIYVAPPDHHLLLHKGHVRVVRGPRENRHRPAIDPLFRSAARAYRQRAIGVILSGALDDGSAGLFLIKKMGGLAIVQDPSEALFPDMPRAALEYVKADYVVPSSDLANTLVEAVSERAKTATKAVPQLVDKEIQISEFDLNEMETMPQTGNPSPIACPECNGVLWEMNNGGPIRYRCHVGHSFTAATLLAEKANSFEAALWEALRALEERATLARRMALRAREMKSFHAATRFDEQAETRENHAQVLRRMLMEEEKPTVLTSGDRVLAEGTHDQ